MIIKKKNVLCKDNLNEPKKKKIRINRKIIRIIRTDRNLKKSNPLLSIDIA